VSSPFVDAFNVISLIAVFVLISLGLHFTFGMLGLVNLVHGELLLIGGYATYAVTELTGSVLVGMLMAPIAAGLVGLAMERGVLRFLYQRPLDSLLATFGLAVIIRQAVQLIYTASPRSVPDLMSGSWTVLGINIPRWRLVLALLAVLLVVGTWWLLERTRFGLRARAVVANPDLAESVGLDVGGIRAGLFSIGAGLAGLAGGVLAPISTLDPQFGLLFLVNAFMVTILGGPGSLAGLVLAAVVLGGSLALLQFVIPTVFAQILVLVIAVVGVRLRPVVVAWLAERRSHRAVVVAE
jgi:branched-chain amino acid transport system permease protein/urea transport system permease protein